MLHLIESEEAPARPGHVHHAFEVEDYDTAVPALHGKNISIERTGVRKDGQRYLFIRDHDGKSCGIVHAIGILVMKHLWFMCWR